MKNTVICTFGSSIIEGTIGITDPLDRWYNLLHRKLSGYFPKVCFSVINAGIGGESTRECMLRFERDVLAHSPDYLLVMAGANNEDYTRPERIVPLGEIQRHLEDMVNRLPGKTQIVGVGLSPVVNEWHWAAKHAAFEEPFRECGGGLDELLEPQRELARRFFLSNNYPFLDLYPLFDRERRKYLLKDGIHLNRDGHQLFGENMFSLLKNTITQRDHNERTDVF